MDIKDINVSRQDELCNICTGYLYKNGLCYEHWLVNNEGECEHLDYTDRLDGAICNSCGKELTYEENE